MTVDIKKPLMVLEKQKAPKKPYKESDLLAMKESFSQIIATFTYMTDPFSSLKQADVMIQWVAAMLDVKGELDNKFDNSGKTYRELLFADPAYRNDSYAGLQARWQRAVQMYNQKTGDWKFAWAEASKIISILMRIAAKENLMAVKSGMFKVTENLRPGNGGDIDEDEEEFVS